MKQKDEERMTEFNDYLKDLLDDEQDPYGDASDKNSTNNHRTASN